MDILGIIWDLLMWGIGIFCTVITFGVGMLFSMALYGAADFFGAFHSIQSESFIG